MNLPPTMQETLTLVDLLSLRAGSAVDGGKGYTFIGDESRPEQHLCYADLDRQARRIAAGLLEQGWHGHRCLILASPGPAYIASLFGCLYAGITAVTAYPPRARRRDERLAAVMRDAEAGLALGDAKLLQRKDVLCRATPELRALPWIDVDAARRDGDTARYERPPITADQTAVLQYTSGSTADPRGVQLTHRNLIHNLRVIFETFDFGPTETRGVCWLPPYHDMGLIGGLLQPLYSGLSTYVMPPAAFIQKPLRWLQAISKHRGNISGGPNFAYDLCVDHIRDDQLRGLDLSCWTLAFNGAEPLLPQTMERFAARFRPCGFQIESFLPCYGLAEATLMVSGGPRQTPPQSHVFEDRRPVVSSGLVSPLHEVRIVDPDRGVLCPDGEEGEIWIASESVSSGYWRRTEATQQVFEAKLPDDPRCYLRSGDLGRMLDGQLFVTGRLKDLIVLRGRNLQPHELEAVAENAHDRLARHGSAAFTITATGGRQAALALAMEVRRGTEASDYEAIVEDVRRNIAAEFDVAVAEITLLRSGGLPRTSSGKPRRGETRTRRQNQTLRQLFRWPPQRAADHGKTPEPINHPTTQNVPETEIRDWLVRRIAKQLSLPTQRVRVDAPFAEFGLDSVSAVMIAGELETLLGQKLPATLFYDAPDIATASRIVAEMNGQPIPQSRSADKQHAPASQLAVVGVACRLPGCDTPDAFWNLVHQGRVVTAAPPADREASRWPDSVQNRGGWLSDIDRFDAGLFGIAPNEAKWMDPQHRLLLETCWQAVENAGLNPRRLGDHNVGAFVGISNADYGKGIVAAGMAPRAYSVTGNAASMAAHRLSYHLNLRGPSLSIDTACSSSLVAVHQARRSLQAGDCDHALVAGVNLILRPDVSAALGDAGMLAPDGLCKSFDARADGYVRGEGCLAMLLKPADAAQRDGDPILAIIAGSAINQDGRTNGITAPNGSSQTRLIRAALKDASLLAEDVTLIEAHGTGTILGDPIEMQALRDVYDAAGSAAKPCAVGSVKANVGHLESAAGIAGLLKAVLAVHHGEIPPMANFETLNPHISLDGSRLQLPTQAQPWQTKHRVAAVSSFGFGGTNAHVLVRSAEPQPAFPGDDQQRPPTQLLTLSAHDEGALGELAAATAGAVETSEVPLASLARTATASRTSLPVRIAVIGGSHRQVAKGLREGLECRTALDVYRGVAPATGTLKVGFLYSGQGGQYQAMGRGLYEASERFRNWINHADELLRDEFDLDVKPFLVGDACRCGRCAEAGCESGRQLRGPSGQTGLFVLQVGLQRWLAEAGIGPRLVLGHSMGEYAAACCAGVLSSEDGLRLTARRALLIEGLKEPGAMAIVFAPEAAFTTLLPESVDVAAVNGPAQTVVSGPAAAVRTVLGRLTEAGLNHRLLPVANGFHSALLEPILAPLADQLRQLAFSKPEMAFVSTVTGTLAGEELCSPEYWQRHTRRSVQFATALQTVHEARCDLLIELGPHPTLCSLAALNPGTSATLAATLQRDVHDVTALQRTLAQAYVMGAEIQWGAIATTVHGPSRRLGILPNYPFQRRRYWLQDWQAGHAANQGNSPAGDEPDGAKADRSADAAAQNEELVRYVGLFGQVDRLVARYFADALQRVGWQPQVGAEITASQLIGELSIQSSYEKMLVRMCQVLADAGVLMPAADGWVVLQPVEEALPPAQNIAERLRSACPAGHLELDLGRRCADSLCAVLTGKKAPLEVLVPDGNFDELERLYGDSPIARQANGIAAEQIAAAARSAAAPLRILEVGAGTGGTTAWVLERLRASGVDYEYAFTDTSPLFVQVGADKLKASFPRLSFGTLDIERAPQSQGWTAGQFDLVLAANVLHATRRLSETLRHVRGLLADSGQLVLLESTDRRPLLDLIFGLTPGWWRFEDYQLRPDHALLSAPQWHRLLEDSGFRVSQSLAAGSTGSDRHACQTVFLATRADVPDDRAPSPSSVEAGEYQDRRGETPTSGDRSPAAASTAAAQSQALQTSQALQALRTSTSETSTSEPPATDDARRLKQAVGEERARLLQEMLVDRLAEILGTLPAELDVDQPVNNLGVDSLMAIQLKNRVERELDVKIPMVAFLQGHSLRQLMDKMLQEIPESSESTPPNVQTRLIRSTASTAVPAVQIQVDPSPADGVGPDGMSLLGPLSIGQQSLWTIHQMAPTSPAYNFAFLARALPAPDVRGGTICLDRSRLQRAVDRLLQQHHELRTVYRMAETGPMRFRASQMRLVVEETDCQGWSNEAIFDLVRQQADRPFDLQTGPIFRFLLLRHEDGDLLSIAMHHIAADLWSMDLLIQQLSREYVQNGAEIIAAESPGYDSYVDWERQLQRSEEGRRLEAFWQQKLEGAPTVLQLPTSYPRPAVQTYEGRAHNWSLDPEVTQSLRGLSNQEKTTLFTTMLAAYQAFLSRVCNQSDLLVGTVVANRSNSQWESVVGYFLNQLVMRAQLDPTTTFRDLLSRTRGEMLEALEHQDMPFAQLVERLGIARDPSRPPLVQTLFIWDKPRNLRESQFVDTQQDYASLRLQPLLMEQRGAPVDLTLIVFEMEDQLSLAFRYNADLFGDDAIAALADGYTACLTSLVRQPNQPIAHAPLLSRSAYQRQIVDWNDTHRPYQATTALDLFEQQVRLRPDAMAIQTTTSAHRYREVNEQAQRIAALLAEAGVQAGDHVGISLPRGPQTVASILAVWKCGAAYVPLDPDYPNARLQYMVQDAAPVVVVTHDGERFSVPTVSPDGEPATSDLRTPIVHPTEHTDDPAYMIYTSGSSGRPKGTILRHRGLCNLAEAQMHALHVGPGERVLQFASLNFDASIFEIVMALCTGATLCIPDIRSGQPTSSTIIEQLRRLDVTIATLPPSILALHRGDNLPELRMVLSAGEACTASCIENWANGREFFNAYGPTEATVWATVQPAGDRGVPTIGRPICNFKTYVLDENLHPLPVGVPGELCLAGPSLATGYHGLAKLTADRFVPNPFSADDDATLYRTGDRVRYRVDGQIEFLGRMDDQIKISGHRIEPDEIAAAIAQLDCVCSAHVRPTGGDKNSPENQRLVAYYVPQGSPEPTVNQLRSGIRARLPEYMIPHHWVAVDQFPLTANGKVDALALPPVGDGRPVLSTRCVAAQTPTQQRLVGIWQEVLRVEQIGIRDNFFELGGASLQAVQAADLAVKAGLRLAPERMFQYQTIEELAQAIDVEAEPQTPTSSLPMLPPSAFAEKRDENIAGETTAQRYLTESPHAEPNHVPQSQDRPATARARTVVESLGVYVPERRVSTAEILAGCSRPLDFPLERMSGIQHRHVVDAGQFSLDLALLAVQDCFVNSRYTPQDIDVLIACNISRYDGPDFQISFEPTTAARVASRSGMEKAWTFDICNACAGFFTAIQIARAMLGEGAARRVMVVSGEYISHLSRTAQLEIDGFMDPRLACLTLGDAGAAAILDVRGDGCGFEALDLYTAGKHHELCVAQATDQPHGGAIMLTDAVRASAVTLQHAVSHAQHVMQGHAWAPEKVDKLIMHQTSTTTLDGAVEELNRRYGRTVCEGDMAVYNVMQRGNTATTTHWLAVMDQIRSGNLQSGDRAVFAISGSGQTVGTGLYQFDDLPERILHGTPKRPSDERDAERSQAVSLGFDVPCVQLVSAATHGDDDTQSSEPDVVQMALAASRDVLQAVKWDPCDVELLLHAGIYRNRYLSEPAVAAILAGQLEMNEDLPGEDRRRTLAFDLMDAGRSALSACLVAARMLQADRAKRAMVTTGEVENNAEYGVAGRRGIAPWGSALLLQNGTAGTGFGAAVMRRFSQYESSLDCRTKFTAGRPVLRIHQDESYWEQVRQCLCETVLPFLQEQGVAAEQLAAVLAPCPKPAFAAELAASLSLQAEQIVMPSESDEDPFTATLASQWHRLGQRGMPAAGELGLIIGVGAGIEIGCALYHF